MNKEDFFIQQLKNSKYNGDDGAVIGEWVYSKDAFFENVHFKKEWMSLKAIAKKAMLVNISDAIAMNARVKYALLSVAIPPYYTQKQIKKLAQGFNEVASEYGIEIVGGDTIANEKLDITVTLISYCKNPIMRTGMKKGDLLAHTGKLGSVKKDLQKLLNGKKLTQSSRFVLPVLRGDFLYEVAPFVSAGLDISDGLFFELERLSKKNSLGFDFFEKYPHSKGCSGEEYELLFSFAPQYKSQVLDIAKKNNTDLTIFAKAIQGTFECPCSAHHF